MTSCESRHFFRPWNNDIDSNSDCGSSTTSSSPVSSSSSSGGSNNNDSMFCEDSSRESCANSLTTLKNFVDSATDSKKNDKVDKSDCPTAAAAAAAAAWYYHHPYYPTDYPDPHWVQEYQSMQLAVSEISRQEALAKQAKKLRPKKFKCDYCPMTFSNNGQLQGHLRIHTGRYSTFTSEIYKSKFRTLKMVVNYYFRLNTVKHRSNISFFFDISFTIEK